MDFGKRFAQASALTATVALAGDRRASRAGEPAAAEERRRRARRDGRAGAGAGARGADVRQRPAAERVLGHASRLDQRRGLGRVGLRHRRRRQDRPPARGLHAAQGDADRRPQGPGHLRGQPVLRAAPRRVYSQLGRRPRARRPAARAPVRARSSTARTRARRSARSTSRPGSRAASPSCTPSRPARATPTAARPPAAATRRSARPTSSTGSTAAARPTRPAPAPSRRPRSTGTTARRR